MGSAAGIAALVSAVTAPAKACKAEGIQERWPPLPPLQCAHVNLQASSTFVPFAAANLSPSGTLPAPSGTYLPQEELKELRMVATVQALTEMANMPPGNELAGLLLWIRVNL